MTKQNKRMPKQGKPKSKRWFAAASGWGLNLEMGSGETSHKQKRSTVPLGPDCKISENNTVTVAASFLHNTIYTNNILASITQGTGENNRIGNKIHIKSVSLKVFFDTATATALIAPLYVRLMLVVSTKQASTTTFGSGLGSSDLFYTNTNIQANARVDPRLCKVLCDEIIYTNATVAATSGLGVGHIECAINQVFEYQTSSAYGQAANIYFVAIPYVGGGTTGVTQCGSFGWNTAVAYTDN